MYKHAETCYAKKSSELLIFDFIPNKVHFSNVIYTKTRPCTPLLFIQKLIILTLSFLWLEAISNAF